MKENEKSDKLSAEDRARIEAFAEKFKDKDFFAKETEEARKWLRKAKFINGAEEFFKKGK